MSETQISDAHGEAVDEDKRDFIFIATGAAAAAGAGLLAWPLVSQMGKAADTLADGTIDPRYLVMVGVCTHFGCIPVGEAGDFDGWYCPCHASHYDTSGRIRKGPAPRNMAIPDYSYISDTVIKVG
jgi:Rieske Fe-S protein